MANIQLQLRRGTTAEHATFTGATGELTFNTTTKRIHAHDGTTAGGKPFALSDDLSTLVTSAGLTTTLAGYVLKSSANVVAKTETQAASYTLVAGDVYVRAYNTAAQTVTIPNNASVPFPIGTQITIVQVGPGAVTIANGTGVTINFGDSRVCRKQWSAVTITKVATDVWDLIGDVLIS